MTVPQVPEELIVAKRIAEVTDTAIRLPILGWRVGLDFLLGLIPGIGDALMLLVATRIVFLARKMGAPKDLQRAMLRNCLLDFALGFLPVVGDLIDLFFKANHANVRMLEQWWLQENRASLQQATQAAVQSWSDDEDAQHRP